MRKRLVFRELLTADVFDLVGKGQWPAGAWSVLEESGFTRAGRAQGEEGVLDWGDALALLRVAGRQGMPLPLAESLVASWVLDRVGLAYPGGPLTLAIADATVTVTQNASGTEISGTVTNVPWAENVTQVVMVWAEEGGPEP